MKRTEKQKLSKDFNSDELRNTYQLVNNQIQDWQNFIIEILNCNADQLTTLQNKYPEKIKKIEDCGGIEKVLEETSKEKGTIGATVFMMMNLLDLSLVA
jgi:hypothetical protein